MIETKDDLIELAERVFVSDDEVIFVFTEEQEVEFSSGVTESGNVIQLSIDGEFDIKRDGEWIESDWSIIDGSASYFQSNDGYEELEAEWSAIAPYLL